MPSSSTSGLLPALAGAVTSVACAQVPEVSVASIAWKFAEVSSYCPAAVQFPAEEHEIALKIAPLLPALIGAVTSVACAQEPEVSVAAVAWMCAELSWYCPAAVQLPAEAHETPTS